MLVMLGESPGTVCLCMCAGEILKKSKVTEAVHFRKQTSFFMSFMS